jgi:hypothetical protein
MNTSHRVSHALFFVLSLVGVVNGVRAQQARTDSPSAAQSEQPKPQADQAQQAKAATAGDHSSTSSPQTVANSSAKSQNMGPSADILRSARNAGFKIKKVNGTVGFCKSETTVGTHFVSESCISEQQLSLLLERAQAQRDGLQHMVGPPEVTR